MKALIVSLIIAIASLYAAGQGSDMLLSNGREGFPKVYFDGEIIDLEYFKANLTAINYVFDRSAADVYVLITSLTTGSGGREYSLLFKGMNTFSGLTDTIVFYLPPIITTEESRSEMLRNVELGLVPYLVRSPVKDRLTLLIDDGDLGFPAGDSTDKWKNWRMSLSALADISAQKSYKQYGFGGGVYVSKITGEFKFETNNDFMFSESQYNLYEGDSIIFSNFSSQRSISNNNLFVRSLGGHFGLGGIGGYEKSDFLNIKNHFNIGPAIEFNVFDYKDYTRRALRFIYSIDYCYTDYMERTVMDKLHERTFTHALSILYKDINDWGDVYGNLGAGTRLNDWSLFAVSGVFSTLISLNHSLFLHLSAGCSYINNQVGLKKDNLSPEEFLLREYEVETDFNYHFSIGFSIELGSKQNNVVNPRFDW